MIFLKTFIKRLKELIETKLTPEYCRRYINHLYEVLHAIIRKNGGWSDH